MLNDAGNIRISNYMKNILIFSIQTNNDSQKEVKGKKL